MIEIHFYGKLRRYSRESDVVRDSVVMVEPSHDETVASLLEKVGIPFDELYNIFLNHKLLATRSLMARWLAYQQVRSNPFDWGLDVAVKSGDRLGLFGRDMALLVI